MASIHPQRVAQTSISRESAPAPLACVCAPAGRVPGRWGGAGDPDRRILRFGGCGRARQRARGPQAVRGADEESQVHNPDARVSTVDEIKQAIRRATLPLSGAHRFQRTPIPAAVRAPTGSQRQLNVEGVTRDAPEVPKDAVRTDLASKLQPNAEEALKHGASVPRTPRRTTTRRRPWASARRPSWHADAEEAPQDSQRGR
jgi:hypothetical protein